MQSDRRQGCPGSPPWADTLQNGLRDSGGLVDPTAVDDYRDRNLDAGRLRLLPIRQCRIAYGTPRAGLSGAQRAPGEYAAVAPPCRAQRDNPVQGLPCRQTERRRPGRPSPANAS